MAARKSRKKAKKKKARGGARLVFEGLTLKQARTLAQWFEAEGSWHADFWFDVCEVEAPRAERIRTDEEARVVTVRCR